jgi:hypothetical protein
MTAPAPTDLDLLELLLSCPTLTDGEARRGLGLPADPDPDPGDYPARDTFSAASRSTRDWEPRCP